MIEQHGKGLSMQTDENTFAQLRPPVSHWIDAFNAHDVDAIVALYREDAELFDPSMKYARRGREEIRRWFSWRFRSTPTMLYMPTGLVFTREQEAAVTWTARGASPRPLGQAWLTRPLVIEGVSVFTLRDGLIQRQRGYFDHLAVVEQVLPALKWLLPSRF
jgi:steroid delta-isomerase-like uncharacterized protein